MIRLARWQGSLACFVAGLLAAHYAREQRADVHRYLASRAFPRWMGIPTLLRLNGPHTCGGACRETAPAQRSRATDSPTRSSAYTVPGRAWDSHPHSPKRPEFSARPRRARRNHLCQFTNTLFYHTRRKRDEGPGRLGALRPVYERPRFCTLCIVRSFALCFTILATTRAFGRAA